MLSSQSLPGLDWRLLTAILKCTVIHILVPLTSPQVYYINNAPKPQSDLTQRLGILKLRSVGDITTLF